MHAMMNYLLYYILFKKTLLWLTVSEFIEFVLGKEGTSLSRLINSVNLAKFSNGHNYYFLNTFKQLACDNAWARRSKELTDGLLLHNCFILLLTKYSDYQ